MKEKPSVDEWCENLSVALRHIETTPEVRMPTVSRNLIVTVRDEMYDYLKEEPPE